MRTFATSFSAKIRLSAALALVSSAAIAQSASGPLNGNYVVTRSSTCSSGVPDSNKPLPQVIDWLVGMNMVSQASIVLGAGAYANWLSGITLSSSGGASVPDLSAETPIQWGTVNSPVTYGANSAVGNFASSIPPFAPPVNYNASSAFIVTSYPLPSGSGTGFYYYDYIPMPGFQTFFRYGIVLSQTSGQAPSASGVSNGPRNQPAPGCSFLINFRQ